MHDARRIPSEQAVVLLRPAGGTPRRVRPTAVPAPGSLMRGVGPVAAEPVVDEVHVHLGLYGTFSDAQRPVGEPVGQVRMRMVGATHYTDLRGATACELVTDAEAAAVHDRLGEDPLRADGDPDRA